ncbi:hypothetical protein SCP_0900030 [Sparassis crispa]|uniref:SLC41A/MgtE integral membrane domain-containing protein n=1 Tax=Sparassis crispa TaxID=139825 RepID=A0A401GVA2_9APHY|nr:hypothetical protein SCP_0900030 [Sparassis crispa]GBE86126.1 hypothetical protein SCP_0900030 [Sparassis crispa]
MESMGGAASSDPASENGTETIELTTRDKTTEADDRKGPDLVYSPADDSDGDSGDEEEGNRALLGSHRGEQEPDGRTTPSRLSTWAQIKSLVIETSPTLLITTAPELFTGELLANVSHWKAMSRVDELIIIVPVILNLKGNLEMNLSARLGTAANMGELDDPSKRKSIIIGNLTLLQVQATVVSFVAACVAFLLGRVIPRPAEEEAAEAVLAGNITSSLMASALEARTPRPAFPGGSPTSGFSEFAMVASAAMTSTCLSACVFGSFMCTLVVLCRRFGLDPDNIAPLVASCLGDLVTLTILGLVSALHLYIIDTVIPLILIILLVAAGVGWTILTHRNEHVKHLLTEGWLPLFGAMIISSGTGLVLDRFVGQYIGYALVAVVATGLSGGVGSVFVSRLSTALHAATSALPTVLSDLPAADEAYEKSPHPSPRLVMVTLLLISLPVDVAFLATVFAFGWLRLSVLFMVLQLVFFGLTVAVSLLLARVTTDFLWTRGLDPDVWALPLNSALVDLVGQLLLVCCYEIAALLGAHVRS